MRSPSAGGILTTSMLSTHFGPPPTQTLLPPWHPGLRPRAATMGRTNCIFSIFGIILVSFPSPKLVSKNGPENEPRVPGELFNFYWFFASAAPKMIPENDSHSGTGSGSKIARKRNQGARKRRPRGQLCTHVLQIMLRPIPQQNRSPIYSSALLLDP